MSKQAVFTTKLESDLPQRESREYEEFLQRKVNIARVSMNSGDGMTNDEVEAEFASRRRRATIQE